MALPRRLLLPVKLLVFGIVTLFVVLLSVEAARSHVPVTGRGHGGRWGTATVTHCRNSTTPQCYGNFTSDTGLIRRNNVRIWYADDSRVGQRLRAYADSDDGDVSRPGGESLGMNLYGSVLFGLLWIVTLLWLVAPLWMRRRRGRIPAAPPLR